MNLPWCNKGKFPMETWSFLTACLVEAAGPWLWNSPTKRTISESKIPGVSGSYLQLQEDPAGPGSSKRPSTIQGSYPQSSQVCNRKPKSLKRNETFQIKGSLSRSCKPQDSQVFHVTGLKASTTSLTTQPWTWVIRSWYFCTASWFQSL